jgi:hypothetical protein
LHRDTNDCVLYRELKDRLRGVAEVVVKDIEEAIQAHSPIVVEGGDKPRVSPETKSAIIAQIVDVADSNNTIRKLVGTLAVLVIALMCLNR